MRLKLYFLMSILSLSPALANDSTGYLAAGGIVLTKTNDIEMRSEDLYISEKEIRIKYHFINTSKSDIKTLVAFPIPEITPKEEGNDYEIPTTSFPNFMNFETKVDGQVVKNEIEIQAVVEGKNRTEDLKKLGIPLSHGEETEKILKALPLQDIASLLHSKLITETEMDSGQGMQKYYYPAWTLKTTFSWEQTFPAQKEIVVEHKYKPFVGGNVGYLSGSLTDKSLLKEYQAQFCTDKSFISALTKMKNSLKGETKILPETILEYVLVTGANWAKPISDFRLVVDKGEAKNFISFCANGVKKISPTQFEVRYKNYTPKNNLKVLILSDPSSQKE